MRKYLFSNQNYYNPHIDQFMKNKKAQVSIEVNREEAIVKGYYDPNTKEWTNRDNALYDHELRMQKEKAIYEGQAAILNAHKVSAQEYTNDKIANDPKYDEYKTTFENNRVTAIQDLNKIITRYQEKVDAYNNGETSKIPRNRAGTPISYLLKVNKEALAAIEDGKYKEAGQMLYDLDLTTGADARLGYDNIFGLNKDYRNMTGVKDDYTAEFFETHSIPSITPRVVAITDESSEALLSAASFIGDNFRRLNGNYVVRDTEGNVIEPGRHRPVNGKVIGVTTGVFSDGLLYYQIEGQKLDKDSNKLINTGETYYISAVEPTVNYAIGLELAKDKTLEARALGFKLLESPRFRFKTESIQAVNSPVPVISIDGNEVGEVEINAVKESDQLNVETAVIQFTMSNEAYSAAKKVDPKISKTQTFNNRSALESFIDNVNTLMNTKE